MLKQNVTAVVGVLLFVTWIGVASGQQPAPVGPGTPAAAQPDAGTPIVNAPGVAATTRPGEGVPSQPAVAVTEVTSPAAPAHYGDQALWALMVSFLIQWLKRSKWFGWITEDSASRLKTQFGFMAAVLTAAGIHFAVSGSFLDDGGASLTVSGLSINALKDVLWQWASQQAWYRVVVKEPREVTITAGKEIIDPGSVSEGTLNKLRGE